MASEETLDLLIILTIWKRQTLNEQLNAIFKQSVKPKEIWIYHCCDHIEVALIPKNVQLKYIHFSFNGGFFGRFALPLLTNLKYVWIVDDDVIPSEHWLETAYEHCLSKDAIIASAGRKIPQGNFQPEVITEKRLLKSLFFGDVENIPINVCRQETVVDFGCNSWFFKTDWIYYFWSIPPISLASGEDIHLSASCSLRGGITTIVPYQDSPANTGNLKKNYGFDENAHWRSSNFVGIREKVFRYFIEEKGWKPNSWIN